MSDHMTDGRRFRILTVIDNCARERLALVADTTVSDNAAENTTNAILA